MRTRLRRLLLAGLALMALGGIPAAATVVVPVSMETLAAGSPLVVLGRVEEVSAVADQAGHIFTLVRVAVGQVLNGSLEAPSLTLKEEGGAVGGMREVVYGTPVYRAGEEVLLFLSIRPDGSLRTAHLALGKFLVTFDRAGMPQVERPVPADIEFFGAPAPPADARPLSDVLALLDSAAANSATGSGAAVIQPQPPEATDPGLPRELVAPYQLNGERFFEPDEGVALGFLIDSTGDAILGLNAARQAVDAAFSAWTSVATATITLTDAGLTDDLTSPCPGPNVVLFNDPGASIPPPSGCTGTLAVGGYCSYGSETKRFAGRTFDRALRARVVFNDGWDGCAVWNELNFAEIATHEIGHAIGLDHSSVSNPEPNDVLRDATMYFLAHFDGRGASLRADDEDAVSALYPTTLPLTITTADPLPPGEVGAPYDVELTVAHASGAVTWTLLKSNDPGLIVTSDGHITGSPTFLGSLSVQVKATDADGNSHTKLLHLTVPSVAATATPTRSGTPSASSTTTPTVSPTWSVTPTATARSTAAATPTATGTETGTPSVTPTPSASATATDTAVPSPTASPTDTGVASATSTVSPTASATASPTASVSTPGPCAGGCTAADPVTVHDLVTLIAVALVDGSVEQCPSGDADRDTHITVADTVVAIGLARGECTR